MSIAERIHVNPVLEREMRERMRGPRAVVVLTIYLAALVGVFLLGYVGATYRNGSTIVATPTDVARIGRGVFEWVLFIQLLLVLFLVPSMTSAAVSGERERQTLIPMQITLLRPRSIVAGKISASLSFLALLLVATMPLLALCYLVGGVSLPQAARGLLGLLITGLILAAITVMCSALTRRTQTASVLAYTFVLLLTLGTLMLYGAGQVATQPRGGPRTDPSPTAMLWVNPVILTGALIGGDGDLNTRGFASVSTPFDGVRQMMRPRQEVFAQPAIAIGGPGLNAQPFPQQQPAVPSGFEHYTPFALLSSAILVLLCVWSASRRLRTPTAVER